jgi:hypothetical protein
MIAITAQVAKAEYFRVSVSLHQGNKDHEDSYFRHPASLRFRSLLFKFIRVHPPSAVAAAPHSQLLHFTRIYRSFPSLLMKNVQVPVKPSLSPLTMASAPVPAAAAGIFSPTVMLKPLTDLAGIGYLARLV